MVRQLALQLTADDTEPPDVRYTRTATVLMWTVGLLLVVAFLPLAPPSHAFGPGGWIVAVALLLVGLALLGWLISERMGFTFEEVLLAGGFAVVSLAILQWLAGPASPYGFLYALPVMHVAAVQRRERVLGFVLLTAVAVCAPVVYAPHHTMTHNVIAQAIMLAALAAAVRVIFVILRSQRRALEEAERRAERLARVDPVTGLANRRAFEESLRLEVARALRRETPLALVIADIDDFKQINDRFGHQRGDRYLTSVARVLDEGGRAGDECFRWGGDEFALLLPGTDRFEAELVIARMAERLAAAPALAIGSERVEMTFGVAQLGPGEGGDELMAAADAMLLSRKRRRPLTPMTGDGAAELTESLRGAAVLPPLELEKPRRRHTDQYLFASIAFVVAAALVYLALLVVAGADLGSALPLVVITSAAAASALLAWQRDRGAAIAAVRAQQRDAVRSARLARKIVMLHDVGDGDDPDEVGTLVVRVAVGLLDAEKGLLLRRETGAGDLELGGHVGFDGASAADPALRRIAADALERDRTVRVNRFTDGSVGETIRNLVAIPLYAQQIACGVVICANREGGFDDLEDGVLLSLGDHAGSALQNSRLRQAARRSYVATVTMLLDAIRVKDPSLGGHSVEVSTYVGRVADALGLDTRHRERLVFGSMLHDIGKLGISERILLKPDVLTDAEREIVRTHPLIGARLVEQVDALRDLADGILHHHERLDGHGYPDGLDDSGISLDARVIAVADSFSAMTSRRPYGEPMALEDACAELERGSGTQFDPRVVAAFIAEVRRDPSPPRNSPLASALAELGISGPETERLGG